jgi:DNA modification methylase
LNKYLNTVTCGNCLEVLKELPDNSVDSIVTDPPYGLSFMGKKWDYDVPSVEIWQACLRVLKPGGFLLSFAGTRTQHRMAVNIEDAGFEIRDMIFWTYASGFPKSLNIEKQLQKLYEKTISSEQKTEHDLRPLRNSDISQTINISEEQGEVLQSELSEQSISESGDAPSNAREGQPSMEGRGNTKENSRELSRDNLSEVPEGIPTNGKEGRLHNATPIGNGSEFESTINKNGGGTSHRPQSEKQQDRKPDAFSEQQITQAIRTYKGFGTALKPSCEPITVARKPLSEKTVAQNVLKYGTGGINIDQCRVETEDKITIHNNPKPYSFSGNNSDLDYRANTQGRFPANLILDGSDEVVAGFPETKSGGYPKLDESFSGESNITFRTNEVRSERINLDSGSASRFFYCAKASKQDRDEGLEGFEGGYTTEQNKWTENDYRKGDGEKTKQPVKNNHPTVKPTKLMQYLVRLVTPKNGIVLDPFTGSGSTGKACKLEGFNFIGIEMEKEYVEIAKARIENVKLPDGELF